MPSNSMKIALIGFNISTLVCLNFFVSRSLILCLIGAFFLDQFGLGALAGVPLPSVSNHKVECQTEQPDAEFLAALSALKQFENYDGKSIITRDVDTYSIHIDTYFHIVTTADLKDRINLEMSTKQFEVLNQLYSPYNIQFNLQNITFTENDRWATNSDEMEMKSTLRQGTYSSLNIYFQSNLSWDPLRSASTPIFGFSSLPSPNASSALFSGCVPPSRESYVKDGCCVHAGTMPGGFIAGNNMGKTAVHEVGHWFGLLHTFWGESCEGEGDYVEDTPQEKTPTRGCPVNKNSCPNRSGMDPVQNYMDYSSDECYREFTPGQQARMFNLFHAFRFNL